jgi:homoserine dehydrogenase
MFGLRDKRARKRAVINETGTDNMRVIRVAIAGFGGVGRATANLLLARREHYRSVYDTDVRLVAVCGSRSGLFDANGLDAGQFDALEPDLSGLSSGRDTIVISKGALVHSGRELRDLAKASGAILKLSGASAAALPTIDLVEHSLTGCRVLSVEGILNATTNFLLDAMVSKGVGFDAALKEAQKGGFAEADTRNDTEGWDTACKLLLLANFGLGAELVMDDLVVEGIHGVTADRIDAWRAEGLVPKLVGSLECADDGTISARVGVRAYANSDPLAQVSGKNKAIRITTDAMGETIAIGCGEEPLATAAAALKDFEHILKARVA